MIVLLTDGEERGLLGTQAFVADDPLRATPLVVLNWEARGTSGPSLLFQTAPGNARLVQAYAAAAPHPAGDSSLAAAYEFLPNDTAFTEFLDAGRPGLNVAFIGDPARYHTAQYGRPQAPRKSLSPVPAGRGVRPGRRRRRAVAE